MKKYLITGLTGSGKSTVCRYLSDKGYEAYDLEDIPDMFAMYREGTRELFTDFDNADPEKIRTAEWLCDPQKLASLMENQRKDFAFYCGAASNMDELIPMFDTTIMLSASPEVLNKRLSTREGTDDMGNSEASRKEILGWKKWWEDEMNDKGIETIQADGSPEENAEAILRLVNSSLGSDNVLDLN